MILNQIEPFLQNLSFITLFLVLLFFWIQASLLLDFRNESFSAELSQNFQNKTIDKLSFFAPFGTIGFIIANVVLGLLLILRGLNNGYFPLSNLYESLMFLSWTFTALHLILEKILVLNSFSPQNQFINQNSPKNSLLGVITAPMALFTNAFATFSLPLDMQKATSLVPALQSNWLMMHVTIMMLSYATLLIGCVFSIAFLVLTYFYSSVISISNYLPLSVEKNFSNFASVKPVSFLDKNTDEISEVSLSNEAGLILQSEKKLEKFDIYYSKLLENLDNLSYRVLGFGFPLLTIGILSGAVWANEAWGSYWSWDPKETWALITWLIFACYFHVRITKGWKGEKPAILAAVGFFIIWICYLGVNLIGKGLHSYGWISGG